MATMAQGTSPSNVDCTICLEEVSDSRGRTAVTLRCGHTFHLDCIGSAFNVKGAMECPNCREMENGLWQHFRNDNHEEITDEEEDNDEDYDEFEMSWKGEGSVVDSWESRSIRHLHSNDDTEDEQGEVRGQEQGKYSQAQRLGESKRTWDWLKRKRCHGLGVKMPEPETRHRWVFCLPSPGNPIAGEQHHSNRPPVSRVISASLALLSSNNPNNSDPNSGSTSVDGHINGGTQVSVPSAALETTRGEVHQGPNLDSIALPVFLGQGIHDHTPVHSSSGLTHQGNIDGGIQLPSNSPSPVVRYSLSSVVRSSGSNRWLQLLAGQTAPSSGSRGWLQVRAGRIAPSLNETGNSNCEASGNSIDQTLQQDVVVHYQLLAMLELRLASIRRRIRAEYHQFFPDRANASPDA